MPDSIRSFADSFSINLTPVVWLLVAAVASLGLFVINITLDVGLSWLWSIAGQSMVYDLAKSLFQKLQRLSLIFHNDRSVGDSLNRMTGDAYCVYALSESLLVAPGRYLISLLAVGSVAWQLSPFLTLVSLVVAPFMAVSALFFGSRIEHQSKLRQEIRSRLIGFVQQTLSAIPIIQVFGSQQANARKFDRLATEAVALSQRDKLVNSSYSLVNGAVTTICTASILYLGGLQVLSGALTIASLLVLLAYYLRSMQQSFRGIFATCGTLKSAAAKVDRVLEILESEDMIKDTPGAQALSTDGSGHLCLQGVTFGYQAGAPILKDINLEVKPGETLALVGATGAGKPSPTSP